MSVTAWSLVAVPAIGDDEVFGVITVPEYRVVKKSLRESEDLEHI
jgi:hypothetical protein